MIAPIRTLSLLAAAGLLSLAVGCSSSSSEKSAPTAAAGKPLPVEAPLPAGATVTVTPALPTTVSTAGTVFTVTVLAPNGLGISNIPLQLRLSPASDKSVSTAVATFVRLRPDGRTPELTDEGLVVYGLTRPGGVYHFHLRATKAGGRDRVEMVVGDKHYTSEFDTVTAPAK